MFFSILLHRFFQVMLNGLRIICESVAKIIVYEVHKDLMSRL